MKDSRSDKIIKGGLILLLFVLPIVVSFIMSGRQLFIDDAYITFRYAENLAAGKGFVYNAGERVLGTTTPLYCLWLALWKLMGVPVSFTALATGSLAVSFTALLLWLIGKAAGLEREGLAAAFILFFFPRYWEHMTTGMETTLAGALCLAVIWLDLKGKSVWCGIVSGMLVLVRPDAGTLVAAVLSARFFMNRLGAIKSGTAAVIPLLPWAVFGFAYFGNPLPSSLAVKRLIHPFPWHMVLKKYLYWFLVEPSVICLSILWIFGAFFIIRHRRDLAALVLWPLLFFGAMSATRIGPFFWYKVPVLPAYFLVAAAGAWFILKSIIPESRLAWRGRAFAALTALIIAAAIAIIPLRFQKYREIKLLDDEKESIYKKAAELIKESGSPGNRVYVGDVGVIGYFLMDYYIIDSSGLNSPDVYRVRLEDRMRLLDKDPSYRYDWWGTPQWSYEIIQEEKPDFIMSDIRYLHLRTLLGKGLLEKDYNLLNTWSDSKTNYVLLERINHENP